MSYLQGLRSSGKKIAVITAALMLSAGTFYSVAQSGLSAPAFSNITVQSTGEPYSPMLTYTLYLSGSPSGATIYYTLHLCDQSYTVNSSIPAGTAPNKIVVSCTAHNGIDDGTGSAYLTYNGSTSPTAYASF